MASTSPPSSGMPTMFGIARPSPPSTLPSIVPCSLSTWPIAAMVFQPRPHAGFSSARRSAAPA
jgi:hypothetical protein